MFDITSLFNSWKSILIALIIIVIGILIATAFNVKSVWIVYTNILN